MCAGSGFESYNRIPLPFLRIRQESDNLLTIRVEQLLQRILVLCQKSRADDFPLE